MQKTMKRWISGLLLISMISASMNTAGAFFCSPVFAGEDGQSTVEEQLLPTEENMENMSASADVPATDLQTTDISESTPAAEYTVRFEVSGLGEPAADQIVSVGSLVEKPADPAAEGFRFTGWYRDAGLMTPWIFEEDIVTENITLFAGWEQGPSGSFAQKQEVPFENEEEQTEERISETEDLKTVSEDAEKGTDEKSTGENETLIVLNEAAPTDRADASPAAEINDDSMADNTAQTTGEETDGAVENSNTDDADSSDAEEAEGEEAEEEEEAVDTDPDEDLLEEGPDLLDEAGTPGNWGGTMMNLTAASKQAQADIDSGKIPNTVTVAVIDSGVNAGQSVFSGRIDTASRSFIDGDTSDAEGHGTHVAGIIAQNTPSAVKLMNLKALDDNKSGYAGHVAEAIKYAADNGAGIINLSLGASEREGRPYLSVTDREAVGDSISYAQRMGCVVVTSAGNDGREITGTEAYPAGETDVVTVAAVTEGNKPELCSFSNYGAGVSFCAPGRQITSSNGEAKNGTSMAAANISAALAILKLYNPGVTGTDLIGLLGQNEKNITVKATVNETGKSYYMIMPVLPEQMEYHPDRPERPVIKEIRDEGYDQVIEWDAIEGVEYTVYRGRETESDSGFTELGTTEGGVFRYEYTEGEWYYAGLYEVPGRYFFYVRANDDTVYKHAESDSVMHDRPLVMLTDDTSYYIKVGETRRYGVVGAVAPPSGSDPLEWTCSDPSVASYETTSDTGVAVTGLQPGTTELSFCSSTGIMQRVTVHIYDDEQLISGRCGDSLNYTVTGEGDDQILVISGTGDMWDAPFTFFWPEYLKTGRSNIRTIVIEDGVTSIGKDAFRYGLPSVTSVRGMRDVIRIGDGAFQGCYNLQEITFPEKLETIGKSAFSKTAVIWDVPDGNAFFSSEDGVLFNKEKTRLVAISYKKDGEYVIPDTVREIEKYAFDGSSLSDITVQEGITVITEETFVGGSMGYKLHLPDSIEIIERQGVDGIKSVNIPANLKYIGKSVFRHLTADTLILPETVTRICKDAFCMSNIGVVEIPESITELDSQVFEYSTIDTLILPQNFQRMQPHAFNESTIGRIVFRGFTNQYKKIQFRTDEADEYYPEKSTKAIFDKTPFSIEAFGEWNGFSWRAEGLSGDLTLTISGNGNLPNVNDNDGLPWKEGIDEITKIVLEDGITGIGKFGFYNYKNLKEIHMTDSMRSYGENALRFDPVLEKFVYCPAAKTTPMNVYTEYLVILHEEGLTYKPAIEVTFGDTAPLKEGTDYTIIYPNVKVDGQGLITITFKGAYADYGTFSIPLIVTSKLMEGENIKRIHSVRLSQYTFIYDGTKHTPAVIVSAGRKSNVPYKVSPADYGLTNVGSRTITVEGTGDYKQKTKFEQTFSVIPASIAGASVSVPAGPYRYYGGPNQPGPTVVLGSRVLRHGSDYSLTYANNVDAGTATVYVNGTGNYTGTCAANFKIEKIYQNMSMYVKGGKNVLTVGDTAALAVPGAVGTKTYTSTDPSVVSVSKNGILTARKAGEAVILVIAKGDHNYYSADANVKITVREKDVKKPAEQTAKPTGKPAEQPAKFAEKMPTVFYCTHVQSKGWMPYKSDGLMSGTQGEAKRLEAIRITLSDSTYKGRIEYRTHVQTYGWQKWKKDNDVAGTQGEAKRLEAIQIRLTGELAKHYDVYYQTHIQSFGWSGWASNGEMCGSAGYAKRLEGIRILLRKKGSGAPDSTKNRYYVTADGGSPVSKISGAKIGYNTHVQTYGWQNYSYDGGMAGTQGEAKRLEGIHINLIDRPYDSKTKKAYTGSIVYRTHVQTYGWQPWKKNGQMSGTSGKAKRLEGIQIYLTGEMAKHYDIYYCVHAQTYGWLDWAKNGQMAGTSGLAKRLEGIKIKLVPKGGKAPGSTKRPNVVGGGGKLPDNPYKE